MDKQPPFNIQLHHSKSHKRVIYNSPMDSMNSVAPKGYGLLYIFSEPTGSIGQGVCRMSCAAGMTINSWETGSSGSTESCPHVISHYTTITKAYYQLKRTWPSVKWRSKGDWRKTICYNWITDRWCTSWCAAYLKNYSKSCRYIIGLLQWYSKYKNTIKVGNSALSSTDKPLWVL